jgi:dolichol-phosphate mannosyltransferase
MKDPGRFNRWVRFNGIGALGAGLQLAVLGVLTRLTPLHYLWATVVAVEATVLHNFCWHERWTWSDRRAASRRHVYMRLGHFQMTNGLLSIAGNVLLMRAFTGSLGMDPLAANIVSILICSLANFVASEWLVFRRAAAAAVFAVVAVSLHPMTTHAAVVDGAELQAATVQAWTAYERAVDARYDAAAPSGTAPFFALDGAGEADWRGRARGGAIPMARIERPAPGAPEIDVPNGKIHHWTGAIFVPGVSVDELLKRLAELAGNEQKYYADVLASRMIARQDDRYQIFMKLRRTKVITVTYNTEHEVRYRRLGTVRASARSVATRIAQLDDAGTPQEHELKPGSDSGYLWRLNAYWRYEAVPGGVLIECESVSLSRAVPFVLRPFATGLVEGLARESLERTLTGLRAYLTTARTTPRP